MPHRILYKNESIPEPLILPEKWFYHLCRYTVVHQNMAIKVAKTYSKNSKVAEYRKWIEWDINLIRK